MAMSIVNVLLGFLAIILILIALVFCAVIAAVLVISIWSLVRPWVSPVIEAWLDWVDRRIS